VKALEVRENELGMTAVRLHYTADPEKNINHPDPEIAERAAKWLEYTRRLYPDPVQWSQEMEISWWIAAGLRVYPEFSETLHCDPVEHRARKVIYRAWDFGWITPACVIGQIDPRDRLVILREIIGKEQTTKSFAEDVIAKCAEWYPNHSAGFQDFCDPAGQQHKPTASERSETQDTEILKTLQIFPSWEHGWSRKDGRSLIHQLLTVRTDDTPSMYVHPTRCPVLLQGFLGKFVYPATKDGRAKEEPDEANHPWADAQACLRYLATGLYSALGLRRFRYQNVMKDEVPDFHGYGTKRRTA
jgi:hypothetical protein